MYKIAIIGFGNIAQKFHFPAWLRNNKSKVVAICDKNISMLKKKHNLENYKTYTNIDTMIKNEDFNIVNILTPPYLHFMQLKKLIKHNKKILIEKPFVINNKEIKNIVKISPKNSYIQCCYHQRFRPISIKIKDLIKKNVLGDIYYINIIHRKFRSIPKHSEVFSKKKFSGGGPLIDLGSHYFDLVGWFLNFPKYNNLNCSNFNNISKKEKGFIPFKSFDNEELSVGSFKFSNNIHVNFELSYVLNTSSEKVEIEIFGTNGSVTWPQEKYVIIKNKKVYKKKILLDKSMASDNQINNFLKNMNRKKLNSNLKEYAYVVNLIELLYAKSLNV
jgi:predicted dehydrogenase